MVSFRLQLFAVISVASLIFVGTNGIFSNVDAQKLTKNQLKQCELLYFNYKKFGEKEFLKRYEFKSFIKDCIKLYKDPTWTFSGKKKIDNHFDKISDTITNQNELSTKIIYKLKVGQSRFLVGFTTCVISGNNVTPSFLISSSQEQLVGSSSKMISNGQCRTFSTDIQTPSPHTISVEYIGDLKKYSELKVRRL